MGTNQHVVKRDEEWVVVGEGNQKPTSVHETQAEAWARAKEVARNQQSEAFLHGENGRVRERNTYGHDPFPPKG